MKYSGKEHYTGTTQRIGFALVTLDYTAGRQSPQSRQNEGLRADLEGGIARPEIWAVDTDLPCGTAALA